MGSTIGRSRQKDNRQSPLFYAASIVYIRRGYCELEWPCNRTHQYSIYNHLPINLPIQQHQQCVDRIKQGDSTHTECTAEPYPSPNRVLQSQCPESTHPLRLCAIHVQDDQEWGLDRLIVILLSEHGGLIDTMDRLCNPGTRVRHGVMKRGGHGIRLEGLNHIQTIPIGEIKKRAQGAQRQAPRSRQAYFSVDFVLPAHDQWLREKTRERSLRVSR